MEQKRGKILVIEGTDGSGKETQARMLYERLINEKISVIKMSFPIYDTPTGRIISECYLGKNGVSWFGDPNSVDPKIASLYYAADRLAAKSEIEEIIVSGTNLILDRYYASNMAHQGGKLQDNGDRIKMFDWLGKLELSLLKLPKEDKTIFLYMPYKISMELKRKMNVKLDGHEINETHLKNAEESYLQLAQNFFKWTKINCASDGTITSLRTPEDIHEEVYLEAMKVFS